jgi:hypothetical protein
VITRLLCITSAVVVAGCVAPRIETGAWNYSLIRVSYNFPLSSPVSVGRVVEIHGNESLPVGDYVPLAASRDSPEWKSVYFTEQTETAYVAELATIELRGILQNLGLSSEQARRCGVSRIVVRATGRKIQAIENRSLLEDVLNSSEFPLSEIEALHLRLEARATLQMCLLEETATQVVLVLHTKRATTLAPQLRELIAERRARKEMSLSSVEVRATNDVLEVALRGNIAIRRIWGNLVRDQNNRVVISWNESRRHG